MRRFAHAVAVLCVVVGPIDKNSGGSKLAHGLVAIVDRMVCAQAHVWYRPHMQQSLRTTRRLLMMVQNKEDPFESVLLTRRERDVVRRLQRMCLRAE